ncbi:MAG: hypothetical protein U0802_15945 [Candidatus Binatia bacterium]
MLPTEAIARRFGAHLPAACASSTPRRWPAPSLEHDLVGFRYRVAVGDLLGADGGTWIDERLAAFLAGDTYPLRKRSGRVEKTVDARPLVHRLVRIAPHTVEIDVGFSPAGSLKPTELLASLLDLSPDTARALPLTKTHAFQRTPDAPRAALASAPA